MKNEIDRQKKEIEVKDKKCSKMSRWVKMATTHFKQFYQKSPLNEQHTAFVFSDIPQLDSEIDEGEDLKVNNSMKDVIE